MPYSITTRDGITIQNIPDNVPPDSPELKQRVEQIRAQRAAGTTTPPGQIPGAPPGMYVPPALPEELAPAPDVTEVLPEGADAQAAYLDRSARVICADVRRAAKDPERAAELAAIEAAAANRKTVLAALAEHAA